MSRYTVIRGLRPQPFITDSKPALRTKLLLVLQSWVHVNFHVKCVTSFYMYTGIWSKASLTWWQFLHMISIFVFEYKYAERHRYTTLMISQKYDIIYRHTQVTYMIYRDMFLTVLNPPKLNNNDTSKRVRSKWFYQICVYESILVIDILMSSSTKVRSKQKL